MPCYLTRTARLPWVEAVSLRVCHLKARKIPGNRTSPAQRKGYLMGKFPVREIPARP